MEHLIITNGTYTSAARFTDDIPVGEIGFYDTNGALINITAEPTAKVREMSIAVGTDNGNDVRHGISPLTATLGYSAYRANVDPVYTVTISANMATDAADKVYTIVIVDKGVVPKTSRYQFSTVVSGAEADTVTTIAARLAAAINANPAMPATATSAAGVVTITAKTGKDIAVLTSDGLTGAAVVNTVAKVFPKGDAEGLTDLFFRCIGDRGITATWYGVIPEMHPVVQRLPVTFIGGQYESMSINFTALPLARRNTIDYPAQIVHIASSVAGTLEPLIQWMVKAGSASESIPVIAPAP